MPSRLPNDVLKDPQVQRNFRALDARFPLGTKDLQDAIREALWKPGMICATGGSTADEGFLLCDGSAISRTDFADLFDRIGTNFGSGDGSTTFNLPTQDDAALVGVSGTITLGSTGGAKTHTLTTSELPAHTHDVTIAADEPANVNLGGAGARHANFTAPPGDEQRTYTSASTGSGSAHNNMPPFIGVNFQIKT